MIARQYIIAFSDVFPEDEPLKTITAIEYPEAVLEYTGHEQHIPIRDGCAAPPPPVSLVYTHVKVPLTLDLNSTAMPVGPPHTDRIIEVREPFTRLGLSARVKSNAIGEIAENQGIRRLYFADQEILNVLGIWQSRRVILYGDGQEAPSP